jgi:hypothetical protein
MAHVPTFRTLANMKAKDIPSYLASNASVSNLKGFWRDWNTYYYSKFVAKPNRAPLVHVIVFCRYYSLFMTVTVSALSNFWLSLPTTLGSTLMVTTKLNKHATFTQSVGSTML